MGESREYVLVASIFAVALDTKHMSPLVKMRSREGMKEKYLSGYRSASNLRR